MEGIHVGFDPVSAIAAAVIFISGYVTLKNDVKYLAKRQAEQEAAFELKITRLVVQLERATERNEAFNTKMLDKISHIERILFNIQGKLGQED